MIEKIPKPQEEYKNGYEWLGQLQKRNEEPEPSWQSLVLEGLCFMVVIGAFVGIAAFWGISGG